MSSRIRDFLVDKEYIKTNISKEISRELDVLYKWVFRWHDPRHKYGDRRNTFLLFVYNFFVIYYRFIQNYTFSRKAPPSQYDIIVPYLEKRSDHFIALMGAIHEMKKSGKKVVIVTYKSTFEIIKSCYDVNRFDFIFIEDNVSFRTLFRCVTTYQKMFLELVRVAIYLRLSINETASLLLFYKNTSWDYSIFKGIIDTARPSVSLSLSLDFLSGYLRATENVKKVVLQHGIGPALGNKIEANRADVYMVWGDLTFLAVADNEIFPFYSSSNIVSVGNPKMNYIMRYNLSLDKSDGNSLNKILFISTKINKENFSYASIEIMSNTIKMHNLNQQFEVTYKLHPSEDKSEYSNLNLSDNFSDANSEKNLYDLIYESDIVVGTMSTGLIEAMAFNKPVIQVVPHDFIYSVNEKYSIYNVGILRVHNEKDLYTMIMKLSNNKEYASNCMRQQEKIVKMLFGDYKDSDLKISNEVVRLCSES